MYVVLFVKKSNHSSVVGVFSQESLARIYCQMKNEDAWIDKGKYECLEAQVLDDNPELAEYILKSQKV